MLVTCCPFLSIQLPEYTLDSLEAPILFPTRTYTLFFSADNLTLPVIPVHQLTEKVETVYSQGKTILLAIFCFFGAEQSLLQVEHYFNLNSR